MKSKMMKHEAKESPKKERIEEALYAKATPKMKQMATKVKAISGLTQPKVGRK